MINIIEENSEIPEMYELRNKHNTYIKEHGYDYSSNLFKQSLSVFPLARVIPSTK